MSPSQCLHRPPRFSTRSPLAAHTDAEWLTVTAHRAFPPLPPLGSRYPLSPARFHSPNSKRGSWAERASKAPLYAAICLRSAPSPLYLLRGLSRQRTSHLAPAHRGPSSCPCRATSPSCLVIRLHLPFLSSALPFSHRPSRETSSPPPVHGRLPGTSHPQGEPAPIGIPLGQRCLPLARQIRTKTPRA